MSRVRSLCVLLCAACVAVPVLRAQVARYQAQPDTSYWSSPLTDRWALVHRGDTLRRESRSPSLSRSTWQGSGDTLTWRMEVIALGPYRVRRVKAMRVLGSGYVLSVDGMPRDTSSLYVEAVLPRLPREPRPLRVGDAWVDTIGGTRTFRPSWEEWEEVRRHQVARELDTLGARVIEVVAEGVSRLRVRDEESAGGGWLDIAGPSNVRWYFDVARGRLLGNRGTYQMRGTAVMPSIGGTDTLVAERVRQFSNTQITPEHFAYLARELPVGDTLWTEETSRGVVLLNTFVVAGDSIHAGTVDRSGVTGTASVRFGRDRRPVSAVVVWTDTSTVQRTTVRRADDQLVFEGDQVHRTQIPDGPWGIADEGMEQLLWPMLAGLTDRVLQPVSIYRPRTGRWEGGRALPMALEHGFAFVMQGFGAESPTAILFDKEGRLLTAGNERTGRTTAISESDKRFRILERLVQELDRQ